MHRVAACPLHALWPHEGALVATKTRPTEHNPYYHNPVVGLESGLKTTYMVLHGLFREQHPWDTASP